MNADAINIFFFNDTATTEIYTLSLHDALPIYYDEADLRSEGLRVFTTLAPRVQAAAERALERKIAQFDKGKIFGDRKSTRLNSSHLVISYAVFCLKKIRNEDRNNITTSGKART